jgi:protein-disulfide isomerase
LIPILRHLSIFLRTEKILITINRAVSILLAATIAAAIITTPAGAAEPKKTAPGLGKERIEKLIEGYILGHPEVILKSVQQHEAREKAALDARAKANLNSRRKELTRSPGSPVGGNPDGDVTVVEFFDYQCSYCRRSFLALMEIEKTDPKVRIVFKEFPILGPSSFFAARAALAAKAQGKYVEFHKALMGGQAETSEAGLLSLATSLGMDTKKLRQDMDSPAVKEELSKNRDLARALGISGTPAFVIGDELVPGGVNARGLRELIERARKDLPGLRLEGG